MSELVLLHHNEPMTTSLAVAACTENEHASVLVMIQKYAEEFRSFGEVVLQIAEPGISRFQIADREFEIANSRDKRGRPTEFAWLNEGQAMFLMTLLRNNPVVLAFKKALVKAFLELRDRLAVPPAPTFSTGNLSHGADLAVAADRTFRGFLRSAKSAGLRLPAALRVANQQTIARTGMDMLAELGVSPDDVPAGELPDDPYGVARFLDDWLTGRLPVPACHCASIDLYAAYLRWARKQGGAVVPINQFGKEVAASQRGVQKAARSVRMPSGEQVTKRMVLVVGLPDDGLMLTDRYHRDIERFADALAAWNPAA